MIVKLISHFTVFQCLTKERQFGLHGRRDVVCVQGSWLGSLVGGLGSPVTSLGKGYVATDQ